MFDKKLMHIAAIQSLFNLLIKAYERLHIEIIPTSRKCKSSKFNNYTECMYNVCLLYVRDEIVCEYMYDAT